MVVELIVRFIGMILLGAAGWRLGEYLSGDAAPGESIRYVVVLMLAGVALGGLLTPYMVIKPAQFVSRRIKQLPAQELFAIILGLIVGLLIAALLSPVLANLPPPFGEYLPFIAAAVFGYLGMAVMVMRQKDIFGLIGTRLGGERSVSPEERPVLLDTSVIIDGRIADISQTGFISGTMIVPRFVLNELQHIADSPEVLRRNRGRRGLDMLNRLKEESVAPVRITDMDVQEAREVDDKLIMLAKNLRCPILTNDYNMNRVAQLQGIVVLNINELANAIKSVLLPGETIQVRVIQEGKELGQGVGYLDDGTMIVIEEGRPYIGQTIPILVKKVLQKTEGRLVFAQPDLDR
ncbi:MAG TPA: PIN domain-containing protein [Anaerolineae bacterium]|nr:PIN domain-containing protein [Anaerolineae bacterium]